MAGGRKSDKDWRDALRVAVMRPLDERNPHSRKKLAAIADVVVDAALAGDLAAAIEIGNRLDGKPRQEIEHSGETHHYVMRAPAPAIDGTAWREQHEPKQISH